MITKNDKSWSSFGGILRKEWSSTAVFVVKLCSGVFLANHSSTFSMTLPGAMNSLIEAQSGDRTQDLPISVQTL